MSNGPAEVEILINGEVVGKESVNKGAGLVSAPFNGKSGPVTVRLVKNGQTVAEGKGEPIDSACPSDGLTNWNAWVGVAKA